MKSILDWWWKNDRQGWKWDFIGTGEPFCFHCGWLAPVPEGTHKEPKWAAWERASGWLERAHLADYYHLRNSGRLDENLPSNAVPLCAWCHAEMPPFDTDGFGRDEALEWVRSGDRCSTFRQIYTDARWYLGFLPIGAGKAATLRKETDAAELKALKWFAQNPSDVSVLWRMGYPGPGSLLSVTEHPDFIPYVGIPYRKGGWGIEDGRDWEAAAADPDPDSATPVTPVTTATPVPPATDRSTTRSPRLEKTA